MNLKSIVAAFLIALPLSTFGGSLGTNSGGGGDPGDLKNFQVDADIEAQLASIDEEAVQYHIGEYEAPASLTKNQKERFDQLKNVGGWFQYAAKTFRVLKTIGFSFKHPSLKELTADQVDELLKQITFVHGKNLKMKSNSISFLSMPVTFISHPDTHVVEVDYERFFEFVTRGTPAVREKEYKKIAVKMLTIAIHEFLVLEKLEASKTYSASSEFGDAFTLMLKGDLFWRWAMAKKLPFFEGCPYENEEHKKALNFLDSYFSEEFESIRSQSLNYDTLDIDLEERKEDSMPPISAYKLLWGSLFTGVRIATSAAMREHVMKACEVK